MFSPTVTIHYPSSANQTFEIPEEALERAETLVEAISKNPSDVQKLIKEASSDENLLRAIPSIALRQYAFGLELEVLALIFKELISLYEARGNQLEAKPLQNMIEGIQNFHSSAKKTEKAFKCALLSIYLTLGVQMVWGLSFPTAAGIGIGTGLVWSHYPEVSKASLCGLACGCFVNTGLIPAAAIGLGTAIVARIPLVQRAAKATLTTGCDVIGKCAEAGKPIFAATGTALKAAGKGIGNGVSQLTQGVLLPSIKGIFKVGDFAIDCAVFAVRSIDKSLDFLVGKK